MFDDPRWGDDPRERDDDARDRNPVDPRDAFVDKLNLPRGLEREIVRDRDRDADRLKEHAARVERVVLDYELKREYQQFLQERNRGRADSDGRPDRDKSEIEDWARERDLPYFDGHVHFRDVRIEYIDQHG